MAIMVRDLPMDERPREKLVKYGPSYLSNAELLAILLRTGTKESSVLHVAEEVLSHFEGQGLSGLVHMSPDEIAQVNGPSRRAGCGKHQHDRWPRGRGALCDAALPS